MRDNESGPLYEVCMSLCPRTAAPPAAATLQDKLRMSKTHLLVYFVAWCITCASGECEVVGPRGLLRPTRGNGEGSALSLRIAHLLDPPLNRRNHNRVGCSLSS